MLNATPNVKMFEIADDGLTKALNDSIFGVQIDSVDLQCKLHYYRMAYKVAAIYYMMVTTYGLTIYEIERNLELKDLRAHFFCKGIDIDKIISYI